MAALPVLALVRKKLVEAIAARVDPAISVKELSVISDVWTLKQGNAPAIGVAPTGFRPIEPPEIGRFTSQPVRLSFAIAVACDSVLAGADALGKEEWGGETVVTQLLAARDDEIGVPETGPLRFMVSEKGATIVPSEERLKEPGGGGVLAYVVNVETTELEL